MHVPCLRSQSGRGAQRDPTVSHSSIARVRVRFLWGEKAAMLTAHSNLAAPWDAETINHFREGWKAGLVPLPSLDSIRSHLQACFFREHDMGKRFRVFISSAFTPPPMPWTKPWCFCKECFGSEQRLSDTAVNGEFWEQYQVRMVLLRGMAFLFSDHSAGSLAGMAEHIALGWALHQTPQSQATEIWALELYTLLDSTASGCQELTHRTGTSLLKHAHGKLQITKLNMEQKSQTEQGMTISSIQGKVHLANDGTKIRTFL